MMGKRTAANSIALFLMLMLIFNHVGPVSAATSTDSKTKLAAAAISELKTIGVDLSNDNKLNLDKTMTEAQAYNLLADLKGSKLSNKTYSKNTMTISMYLAEILSLIGYTQINGLYLAGDHDISAVDQAIKIGLLKKNEYTIKSNLLRSDAIILFRRALDFNQAGNNQSLKYMVTGNIKYWINTEGKGRNCIEAGVFYEEAIPDCEKGELVTFERDDSYRSNFRNLNDMLLWTHSWGYDFDSDNNKKLWQYGERPINAINPKSIAELSYIENTGKYRLRVYFWRNEYVNNSVVNLELNSILETFYFFTGDQKVSYALWSWIDDEVIHGYKSPKNFGFKEVGIKEKSGTVEMNGVKVKFNCTKEYNEYYFE